MANKKFETLDGFLSSGDVEITGNLAVDTDTLFVDHVNNRVGIGKTNPSGLLDIDGTVTATTFSGSFSGDGTSITNVNASTLDSVDSTSFLRSDTSDSFTSGTLTLGGSSVVVNGGNFRLSDNILLRFGSTDNPGVNMTFNPTGNNVTVNGSNVNFDSGTLFVDSTNSRVGIGKTNPSSSLDINGTITATSFSGDGSGLTGIEGELGYTGSRGFTGSRGATGFMGSRGYTGSRGFSGGTGFTGSRGFTGSQGPGANQDLNTTSNVTFANVVSSGDITAFSDARLKDNIDQIQDPLSIVTNLRGVYFERIDQHNNRRHVGVIAQEIERYLPEVVQTHDDEMKTKSVSYGNIVALLIEAIKEQQKDIEELKKLVGK